MPAMAESQGSSYNGALPPSSSFSLFHLSLSLVLCSSLASIPSLSISSRITLLLSFPNRLSTRQTGNKPEIFQQVPGTI